MRLPSWMGLLEKPDERIVLPWLGGRTLQQGPRRWTLEGRVPVEHGWYEFAIKSKTAALKGPAGPETHGEITIRPAPWGQLRIPGSPVLGFLVGDHLIPEDATQGRSWCPRCFTFLAGSHFANRACGTCMTPVVAAEQVHLLEPLDRFTRIQAARLYENGPLIFAAQLMPLGPEGDVQAALDDGLDDLAKIPGVTPALDAAFHLELHHRREVIRRREAAEAARQAALAQAALEVLRAERARQLGTAEGRREMAVYDFAEAAKAALAVGGATYLDHRPAAQRGETAVRFRFLDRRFECTCDQRLRIIDAGICLVDHETNERGDTRFTLESLPAVIREAHDDGKLVVFRHVY